MIIWPWPIQGHAYPPQLRPTRIGDKIRFYENEDAVVEFLKTHILA